MKQKINAARRRQAYANSVRVNISLPPKLHERVPELLTKHGFSGLSDYYQARMRKDLGMDLVA
jgi:hypothetical protein